MPGVFALVGGVILLVLAGFEAAGQASGPGRGRQVRVPAVSPSQDGMSRG